MRQFDQLLRNRGSPLRKRARAQIVERGGGDATSADSMMLIKALILGGDKRVLQRFGNFVDRRPDAGSNAGQRADRISI